ncbi:MAG: hypothetical protein KJO35_07825 [Gammaproteobacteria bacterium]|nr:hypothetical protein [Gammaproteobacteria bacterium]
MTVVNNKKTIVYVHGHHLKPAEQDLISIWNDALRWGLNRDYPDKSIGFESIQRKMAYFGDLTNEFLDGAAGTYDEPLDVGDRLHALTELKQFNKRKKFNRAAYQRLPGKTALKEMLADVGSPLLGTIGLEKPAIAKLLPELSEYWSTESEYRNSVFQRVNSVISNALASSDEVMIIAHCMGAVISYDALWHLSQLDPQKKISVFVTMGCPLGNRTVQKHLAGADGSDADRYPGNVLAWRNLSAEDDYICHDKTIADDFRSMLKHRLISSIKDFRIYNMAVRYGKSNPHSSVGYLAHPRLAKMVADWL